jgi:hypothetical protein
VLAPAAAVMMVMAVVAMVPGLMPRFALRTRRLRRTPGWLGPVLVPAVFPVLDIVPGPKDQQARQHQAHGQDHQPVPEPPPAGLADRRCAIQWVQGFQLGQ